MLDKIFGFCKKTKCLTEIYSKEQVDQIIASLDLGIKDESVTTSKIAAGAVTGTKIASGAVSNEKILDKAVSNGKIADLAITAAKLATNAVTTAKIADESVTATKLAANAVTTTKIADESVTAAKMAIDAAYKIGSYTGNGTSTSNSENYVVECGFKPRFVLIHCGYKGTFGIITDNGATAFYLTGETMADYKTMNDTAFSTTYFTDTGFIANNNIELNHENEEYIYIAFR